MKKILLSAVSLAVLSGSAFAADLPSRKEAVVAPVVAPLWQGFYAGLNAGYGFGTANNAQQYGWGNPNYLGNLDSVAFAGVNSYMGRGIYQGGFFGGGQVGYNYQYGQSFVLGFETDMQGSSISGQGGSNGAAALTDGAMMFGSNTIQAGINWMGTARGRVGYLITPTVMAYATGGLAYGQTYVKTFHGATGASFGNNGNGADAFDDFWTNNSKSQLNVGWTAGGGFEWMMAPNWSIKGEAMYYDLGSTAVNNGYFSADNAAQLFAGGSTTRAYYQGVIARGGVNYHFNLASVPVVAKF
jgi:outer membrane immunogenic protein